MNEIRCTGEGCLEVFKTDQPVSSSAKYTCKSHVEINRNRVGFQQGERKDEEVVAFQRYQFDRRFTGTNHLDVSACWLDKQTFDFILKGAFQIIQPQHHGSSIPEWSKNDQEIQQILLRSFPKLDRDEVQRQRASRWIRVIYLHYRLCWVHSQIAEEMGLTEAQVRRIIHSIRRAAAGKRADGTGSMGGRRGRPKKDATLKTDGRSTS